MAEHEQDRTGARARSPWKMPARGWKQVLTRTKDEVGDDNVTLTAAGVAFYWLLALFPALAAGVALWALFADPATVTRAFEQSGGLLPEQVQTIVGEQLRDLASGAGGGLGFGAVVGVLLSLWSANNGVKALITGLNVAWDQDEERGFFSLNLHAFGLLALGLVLAGLAVASFAVLPAVEQLLGLGRTWQTVLYVARWPVLAVVAAAYVAFFYRYGPCRAPPHWRWVSPGAILSTVGFLVASAGFSLYVQHFGSYNETYGSLGGVIVLLLWLWLSALVLLMGGELDAELERQTRHPTTRDEGEGPRRPGGPYTDYGEVPP